MIRDTEFYYMLWGDFSKKITMEGGKVVSPKMAIPGIGYLAICEDTEGISFGIIQSDRNAK